MRVQGLLGRKGAKIELQEKVRGLILSISQLCLVKLCLPALTKGRHFCLEVLCRTSISLFLHCLLNNYYTTKYQVQVPRHLSQWIRFYKACYEVPNKYKEDQGCRLQYQTLSAHNKEMQLRWPTQRYLKWFHFIASRGNVGAVIAKIVNG